MPRYDYRCICGYTTEINLAPAERIIICPKCGMTLAPVIHAPTLAGSRRTEGK
jgi:putative FmdB family regulatory protein